MVIKIILKLLTLIILISCNEKVDFNGKWKLEIKLQEQLLPVIIELDQKNEVLTGILFNSDEKIKLRGTFSKNTFVLDTETGYAQFQGKIDGDLLDGKWIRTNKEDYEVEFVGQRIATDTLFKRYEKHQNLIDISGNWKIELEKDQYGLGVFTQKGSRIQGSILTSTGDYRYLDGFLENNKLSLFGFDGVFSFIIDCVVAENLMKGTLYSGITYSSQISGLKDDSFNLEDPLAMTQKLNDSPVNFKHKDIDDTQIDFSKGEYAGKAKVVQLFGSWCPNCIDETHFFLNWRKENQTKLDRVKFIAVSFERVKTKEEALKNLKKLKVKLNIDYDIVLADFDKTKKVTEFFPIEKINAFPTTIFMNSKNKIIKIHTGFSGQATGKVFEDFKVDFSKTIDELIL